MPDDVLNDNDVDQTNTHTSMSREEFFRQPRRYFCKHCTVTVVSSGLPAGWLLLLIGKGGGAKPTQVGIYCSFLCAIENSLTSLRGEYSGMRRHVFSMQSQPINEEVK